MTERRVGPIWLRLLAGFLILVLSLVGCGSSAHPSAGDTSAHLTAVDGGGHVRWRVTLPTTPKGADNDAAPLSVRDAGYFAQDNHLQALRLTDGHKLWSRKLGTEIDGVWSASGGIAVLVDRFGGRDEQLLGLSGRSGDTRWRLPIPGGQGIIGDPVTTPNGELTWWRNGHTEVVNLTTGKIRWSVASDQVQVLPLANTIISARSDAVVALDERSGKTIWTQRSVPGETVRYFGGLLLVTSDSEGFGPETGLTALDPASGSIRWTFDPHDGYGALPVGATSTGILVTAPSPHEMFFLDPTSGRVKWSAQTFVDDTGPTPLLDATDITTFEDGVDGTPMRLVDRSTTNGAVRWQIVTRGEPEVQHLDRNGNRLTAPFDDGANSALQSSDLATGRPLWRTSIPDSVDQPPLDHAGLIIVQSSTVNDMVPV